MLVVFFGDVMVQPSNVCLRSEPIHLPLTPFKQQKNFMSPFRCNSAMVSSPNTYMGPLEICLRKPNIFMQLTLSYQS